MGSDPTRQEIDALLEWCKAEAERFGPDCVIPVLFDLPSAVTVATAVYLAMKHPEFRKMAGRRPFQACGAFVQGMIVKLEDIGARAHAATLRTNVEVMEKDSPA